MLTDDGHTPCTATMELANSNDWNNLQLSMVKMHFRPYEEALRHR
jgi:hypothetical protein